MEDRGGHRGLHSSFPRKIDVELGRGKVKIRVELRHQHSLKKNLGSELCFVQGWAIFFSNFYLNAKYVPTSFKIY
jgi:hypothetical protein